MRVKAFYLWIVLTALPFSLLAAYEPHSTALAAESSGTRATKITTQSIPITGTVHHLCLPGNRQTTFYSVVIGNAFPGDVPEDIDAIEIEGPDGILPISKRNFRYVGDLREFWVVLSGIPKAGTYTFTVKSGRMQGTSTMRLTSIRKIPIPGSPVFSPNRKGVIPSNRPTFSWATSEGMPPLHYQLQIRNMDGGRVYDTHFEKEMGSHRLPDGVLKAGNTYRWRVRAVDNKTWSSVQNRSQTRWRTFGTADSFEYLYRIPERTKDGWDVSSLEDVGVDAAPIHALIRAIINRQLPDIHSVLLVKDGKLVLEEYFHGYEGDKIHLLASVSKSVTSILFGIAVDRGMIPSLQKAAYDYFPEYVNAEDIAQKRKITLEHLLTMSAGLDWDAFQVPLEDPRYPTRRMFASGDPIRYILSREVVAPPGRVYNYNDGLTVLLGEIIRRATGQPADAFAAEHLFSPLAISDHKWDRSLDGTVETNGGLHLRPRDMAKIGLLMLHEGRWGDRQIVSRDWLRKSTQAHIEGYGVGYGYQWRRAEVHRNHQRLDVIYASGYGGQRIFLIPGLEALAVFTSKVLYNPDGGTLAERLFVSHVLPSMLPAVSKPKPLDYAPANLARYVGTYRSKYGVVQGRIVLEGSKLYLHTQKPFESEAELIPTSETEFIGSTNRIGDFRIKIIEKNPGEIDHAIVESGLKRWRVKRVGQ